MFTCRIKLVNFFRCWSAISTLLSSQGDENVPGWFSENKKLDFLPFVIRLRTGIEVVHVFLCSSICSCQQPGNRYVIWIRVGELLLLSRHHIASFTILGLRTIITLCNNITHIVAMNLCECDYNSSGTRDEKNRIITRMSFATKFNNEWARAQKAKLFARQFFETVSPKYRRWFGLPITYRIINWLITNWPSVLSSELPFSLSSEMTPEELIILLSIIYGEFHFVLNPDDSV